MLVTVLHAFPVCTRGKFALSAFYQSGSVDMVDSFERMHLIFIFISPELNKYFCWVKLTKQWQNLKVKESPKGKLLVCWIQALSSWTYFFLPLLPLPAVCFVSDPLSGFDPEMICGSFTSLPSPLPILLQSRHPHQHVSGAVWVSIYATSKHHLVSSLECL